MARAWMRPDTGVWYVLQRKKGKIKIGPEKEAAELQFVLAVARSMELPGLSN